MNYLLELDVVWGDRSHQPEGHLSARVFRGCRAFSCQHPALARAWPSSERSRASCAAWLFRAARSRLIWAASLRRAEREIDGERAASTRGRGLEPPEAALDTVTPTAISS